MKKLSFQGIVCFILLLAPLWTFCQGSYFPQPMRIISFSGSPKSWNLVVLVWVTEAEVVQKKFEIQRSLNGVDFTPIGLIPSNDLHPGPKTYNYQDQDLESLSATRLLYRIRQINSDGSSGYSKILVIDREAADVRMSMSVSPNPVMEQLKISLKNATSAPIGFRLINIEGREMFRQWSRSSTNEYNMPAYAAGLRTPGIYFAQIFFEDGTSASIKFLKK